MNLSKAIAAVVLGLGVVAGAHAAVDDDGNPLTPNPQGSGQITFTGSILDAPCSIAADSARQTVELGQIASAALQADGGTGISSPQFFSIDLEGCTLDTANSVTVTFTGAAGGNAGNGGGGGGEGGGEEPETRATLVSGLGITGTAAGAHVVLVNSQGDPIVLGEATPPQALQDQNNALTFSAYLQGSGDADAIIPGEFQAVTDFTLAYQ